MATAPLPPNILDITLALVFAAILAAAVALLVARVARRLFSSVRDTHLTEPMVRATLRIVRVMTFVVAFAVFAFPALDFAGVNLRVGMRPREIGAWAAETGVRIVALLVLAFAVVRILSAVIVRAEREMAMGAGLDALERRNARKHWQASSAVHCRRSSGQRPR